MVKGLISEETESEMLHVAIHPPVYDDHDDGEE